MRSLPTPYTAYWRTYPTEAEADERTKKQWSRESIAAGIIAAAMVTVARSLTGRGVEQPDIRNVTDALVYTSGELSWHSLRVRIYGLTETDSGTFMDLSGELRDQARESLCLCIIPESKKVALRVDAEWITSNTLFLHPDDIDALARGDWTIDELIEFKFYRSQYLDKPNTETQFDERLVSAFRVTWQDESHAWLKSEEVLRASDDARGWVRHPLVDRVATSIQRNRPCLLIGASSSGKTILTLEAAEQLSRMSFEVLYLNLGTIPGRTPISLGAIADKRPHCVLVIDDLQSNPQAAKYLALCVNVCRRTGAEGTARLLAVSWPDFAQSASGFIEDCIPLYVRPKDVRQAILSSYGSMQAPISGETLDRVQDDLQLLRILLDVSGSLKSTAISTDEIARAFWAKRLGALAADPQIRRTVLTVATLGRYDVLMPRHFVESEARVPRQAVDALISSGVVRVSRGLVTLGHRSLSALLADWFAHEGVWQHFASIGGPEDPFALVRDYLRDASPGLALETLRALYARAGFKQFEKLNSSTAALMATWRAFNALLERIEHQQTQDPQWGGILSSIMFVIQSFAYVGKVEAASESIRFLRSKYEIGKGRQIEVHTADLATTKDFDLIREAMRELDATLDGALPVGWESADELDVNRFHATWLSGVILCAESVFCGDSDPTLAAIAESVAKIQLSSGAFYPQRAVWSTARICLGLAAAGKSIHTFVPLKRAIEWLLLPRERGGPREGGLWRSGTGQWNSDLECTSMAVLACLAAGVDPDTDVIKVAMRYLISQKGTWVSPGHELDGAVASQAYLEAGGVWSDVAGHVQQLSEWAQGEAFWRKATLSSAESFEQSCRVAQTASHLLAIGWSAIRADLPGLLQALDTPERHGLWRAAVQVTNPPPIKEAQSGHAFAEASEGKALESQFLLTLDSLKTLRIEDLQVVGKYCRFEERVRNGLKDWKGQIIANFANKSRAHENFLIWAAPGSGKSFFITEIAETLRPIVQYRELNLAKLSREEFGKEIEGISKSNDPILCMIDEVDARQDESWPYEILFSHLDRNINSDAATVFVLVGSSTKGRHGMIAEMKQRPKGTDLLDRVPRDRMFEIPPMCPEDRTVIFAASVRTAAKERKVQIDQIEKLALYYVLVNPDLASPRQLRDLAYSAVVRAHGGDTRLHYDQLFALSDRRNQEFWAANQQATQRLSQLYVSI